MAVDAATFSPLQRAFLALEETRARLAALEAASRQPIAVIGMGCRVPGADNPASFWELMRNGVDATGPIPRDRWDTDAYYDPNPAAPGRIATRGGGFLGAIDTFDPEFFGIAPREAQSMDPQQRLLLEVSWEALESAGQATDALEGSRTGVFVGACSNDYSYLQLKSGDPGLLHAHFASGIAHSVASGRLSYLMGLQGPSLTIDTACSSSLVAVHLACQSLRSGECDMTIAGGVNLILGPDVFVALSHARMLSPDGRCKTFDAAADGFARGEGCGVVVLKRLRDAEAAGDQILAVIRGSAVNQDGASSGLTAPSGPAQEAVIREALAHSGVAPGAVGFVEAHGTGTELGDPLEVRALGSVFAPDTRTARPLLIGSVKTNVGHLEGAAGVVSLIKVVMSLQHRTVPAHLHFHNPSPHIPWREFALEVPTRAMPWEPIEGRRIGGVSSFGFSGTNAHVVLEEAPAAKPAVPAAALAAGPLLLTLSAHDEAALAVLAARYADRIEGCDESELRDICFTANAGRAHRPQRAAIVAHSVAELRTRLRSLAAGEAADGVRASRVALRDPPRVAFLFTGQGSQYAGMARGLYETSAVFRAALDRCASVLEPLLDRPLLEVMFHTGDAEQPLDRTCYAQPALFSLEYALAELWRSWGVVPSLVMGHSVGEYAAACVAGVFELEDALRLIALRGRLMQALPAGGAMAAVLASQRHMRECLGSDTIGLSVAAINGPEQLVLSGPSRELAIACDRLLARGIRCQPLPVSHAFHSQLLDPMLDEFERGLSRVPMSAPRLRLISNLTGQVAEPEMITRPSYWRRHAREPVRFADGIQTLAGARPDCLIEIGPQPTLIAMAGATLLDAAPERVASLRRGASDTDTMLAALTSLYLLGARIDWRSVDGRAHARRIDLPTYPFQRQRFWFKPAAAPAVEAGPFRAGHAGHALLGARLRSAADDPIFEAHIGADAPSFVRAHRVLGRVILPATAYLEALLACARNVLGREEVCVEDIAIQEAMILDDSGALRAMQTVCQSRNGVMSAVISSQDAAAEAEAPWVTHVAATLRSAPPASAAPADQRALRVRCNETIPISRLYDDLAARGLAFGTDFRVVRELWSGEGQALGRIELGSELAMQTSGYRIHPVLLDGCLQILAGALGSQIDADALYLPIGIGRYVSHGVAGTRCWSHVVVDPAQQASARHAHIRVFDDEGSLLAELQDVQLKRITRDALARLGDRWLDEAAYRLHWEPIALPDARAASPHDWQTAPLAQHAAAQLPQLAAAARIPDYDAFLARFERICIDYVAATFERLGWRPFAGEVVEQDTLAERLRIAPTHRRLFGRLLAILSEDGRLAREAADKRVHWRVPRAWEPVEPAREAERLLASLGGRAPAELELTQRVAGQMAEALRGERDPMELLFPGGSLDTAERMYRDSPVASLYSGLVAEVIACAHRARAAGRAVRILEIGGGTGGTTFHVLRALDNDEVEYTFTDIGPLFVARARERFGAYPFTRFEVLDLERDPATQGFADRDFDIVIAANVIHATSDLRRTLSRVRSLLAPGGLLAMLEVTRPQAWFDLTVGLTPGWWAFIDHDLRPDYATLPRARWLTLLRECGFNQGVALPADADARGSLGLQSLLLARAAETADSRTWLVFADAADGMADALAARLRQRQESCLVVRSGPFSVGIERATICPDDAGDYRRLFRALEDSGRAVRGVLQLACLDAPAWEGVDAATVDIARESGVIGLLHLTQALLSLGTPPPLWIFTRGAQCVDGEERALSPAQACAWGFARSLALEHPQFACVCLDLDPAPNDADAGLVLRALQVSSAERQLAVRGDECHRARLERVRGLNSAEAPAASLRSGGASWRLQPRIRGSLDAFTREPLPRRETAAGEVEIAVDVTALNFKDVLNALGMYPGDPGPLGGECAGRVTAVGSGVTHVRPGDEVMAVAGGAFASHVVARAELVQPRPPHVTPEEAASFPIAYLTAQFCLGHLAAIKAGNRVLIHAAAGGVGMAAVRLAQRAGAEVHATAGAPWKRELLRAMGVEHVYDSRNAVFAGPLMAATGGAGVDVVLNSLSGEQLDASFDVLARGGCFVEIGKRGIKSPEWVVAQARDWAYHIVDWGETHTREPQLIGTLYAQLVAELRDGTLSPLPLRTFASDQVAQAFRFMAQARHAGKIVVRQRDRLPFTVRPDGTYLISGGLSGLGLATARWLAEQGAGRLALIGRRGLTTESAPVVEQLRKAGTVIVTEALDVADATALTALLARLRAEGPPLRGVFHGAGVLDDAGLLQQDAKHFAHVFAPKVQGGRLLDALTRQDQLDCFVIYSSLAGLLGSPGQSNHAAANAVLATLAHERGNLGLPTLCIDWGAWGQVGAAAERGLTEQIASRGLAPLAPEQGLAAMSRLLDARSTQTAIALIDWSRYLANAARGAVPAMFAGLALQSQDVSRAACAQGSAQPAQPDVLLEIMDAPEARRRPLLGAFVRERALRAIGIDVRRAIDPRTPLGELGLDSLLAVELRNSLGAALARPLPATLLFDYPSIDALTDYLLSHVLMVQPEAESQPIDAPTLVDSIESMSDDEVERQFALRTQGKAPS